MLTPSNLSLAYGLSLLKVSAAVLMSWPSDDLVLTETETGVKAILADVEDAHCDIERNTKLNHASARAAGRTFVVTVP